MELNRNGMMDRLVERAEQGDISPLAFWRQAKALHNSMTGPEKTTDYNRAVIALDNIAPPDYLKNWL